LISRRSFQCHQTSCDSEAKHQACVRFWTLGPKETRIELRCTSTLKVCDRHRKAAEAYLLSPGNKEAVGMGIMKDGLPPPDFSSAEVTFVPLVDGQPVEELRVA
jgi:hypothetical protein